MQPCPSPAAAREAAGGLVVACSQPSVDWWLGAHHIVAAVTASCVETDGAPALRTWESVRAKAGIIVEGGLAEVARAAVAREWEGEKIRRAERAHSSPMADDNKHQLVTRSVRERWSSGLGWASNGRLCWDGDRESDRAEKCDGTQNRRALLVCVFLGCLAAISSAAPHTIISTIRAAPEALLFVVCSLPLLVPVLVLLVYCRLRATAAADSGGACCLYTLLTLLCHGALLVAAHPRSSSSPPSATCFAARPIDLQPRSLSARHRPRPIALQAAA
ncbi:hypothetical protein CC78DRAFT_580708 [Lojkania enalia]|uniref:Uncharacterized protein n=1 Tax=Lojkania enalia TaxID=147567 RepID=A0A9P4K9H3_9PLEO|nr:hypothetical protein CC78DRAFT_580708 [Didymosphaeria enalia]